MAILCWEPAIGIHESKAYLYNLQQVNVAFDSLVIIVWTILEWSYWTGDYAWELRILHVNDKMRNVKLTYHRNIRVTLSYIANSVHLLLEIVRPHFSDV